MLQTVRARVDAREWARSRAHECRARLVRSPRAVHCPRLPLCAIFSRARPFLSKMLLAEVYLNILKKLDHKDLDSLLLVNRQLGSLSKVASRGLAPRSVRLNHFHAGHFDLRSETVGRLVSFVDLPRYLEGSQLTDVGLTGTTLDADAVQGMTLVI